MRERSTVVGIFDRREDAERAIDELHRIGFRDDQIGFAWRGGDATEVHDTTHIDTGSHAGEGAVGGMLAGAGIGGLVAAAASLLIPGFGPVLAGGILATVLGGAAVGAAAGGILGALVGMGVPEEEAHYYESEFNEGRILLTVKADGRFDEARDLLYRNGAYDVEHRRETAASGPIGAGSTTGYSTTGQTGTMGYTGTMGSTASGTSYSGMRTWDELSPEYHQRWQTRYGTGGGRWEDDEPGYRFGYEMAHDPRFRDRDFTAVEPELRSEYGTWSQRYGYRYDDTAWDRIREHVREAWDEGRGMRRAA
jgi:hypothetical protein